MCFQVLRAKDTNDAFWSLLEQNGAWIGYHMLGTQGMDVFEVQMKLGRCLTLEDHIWKLRSQEINF